MSSFKIFHFIFNMSIDCFSYNLCYLRFFYIQSIAWILFKNCLLLSHKNKIFEYTPDPFVHYSLCHLLDVRVVREAGVRFALCSHMSSRLARRLWTSCSSGLLRLRLLRWPPQCLLLSWATRQCSPLLALPTADSPADSIAHPNDAAGVAIATIACLTPEHELLAPAATTPDPFAKRHATRKFTLLLR